MSQAFNRVITLNIGDIQISNVDLAVLEATGTFQFQSSLRVGFNVERTDSAIPNNVRVTIYNLSEDNRTALAEQSLSKQDIPVVIEAGYKENVRGLFKGNLNFCRNNLQPPDWITTLEAGDGYTKFKSARINETLDPGTTVQTVLNRLINASGLDKGNVDQKLSGLSLRNAAKSFKNGKVLKGVVSDELSKVFKSAGVDWSIQDGAINVLSPGETLQNTVFVLNERTGLIGVPQAGELGVVRIRSLLQGDIIPGSKIRIESATVEGDFKVKKVKHFGDTWTNDWYTDIETEPTGSR